MITGKDFVFTGLQPWDLQIGSNAKDIALEISKHNRVLYINTPLDKKTYLGKQQNPEIVQRRKVVQKQTPMIRQINQNLWVLDYPFTIWPVNFLPDGFLFDLINKINNKKMYSFVLKILNQLHFNDYILFIDNDIYRSFYATTYLHPLVSIYYRRDNLVNPFWKKHAGRLEPLLCKQVHLIATNSIYLAEAVKIYNTNTVYMKARLHQLGAQVMMSQTVGDDLEVMTGALKEAANQAELVITTGGVSVGQKDLTEEALLSIGAKILFHGIAMKPGMPTLAAEKDGVLFIGLSGNPFSAAIPFEMFVREILSLKMGDPELKLRRETLTAVTGFSKNSRRRRFLRGKAVGKEVWLPDQQANGQMRSMVGCNCLIEIPAGSGPVQAGDKVEVLWL